MLHRMSLATLSGFPLFQSISIELSTQYYQHRVLKKIEKIHLVLGSKAGIEVAPLALFAMFCPNPLPPQTQPFSQRMSKTGTDPMLMTTLRLQVLFQEISGGSNQISKNNYSVQRMNSKCSRRLAHLPLIPGLLQA